MKYFIHILLFSLLLIACKTTKSVSEQSYSNVNDTLIKQTVQQRKDSSITKSKEKVTDTAIGISKQEVADTVKKEDTEIPTTSAGKKVARHFSKKINGLEAWAHIDTFGNISYGATSDSLTLVIKNLTYRYDSLYNAHSYEKADTVYRSHTEESYYIKFTRIVKRVGFTTIGITLALLLGLILLIRWAYKNRGKWMR